jgi:hypothetical protein
LNEAYSDVIAKTDIGLISRNIIFSKIAITIISAFFDPKGKFLDYGGGYGILVRLMRDRGFKFYRYDNQCENLFASLWDIELDTSRRFELVTALEVFEHFTNPVTEIDRMLTHSKSILFTTQLLPDPIPKPDEWWYYALETGQHVSLYSLKTIQVLAKRFDLKLYSANTHMHLLTTKHIPNIVYKIISKHKIASLCSHFIYRKSLFESDYVKAIEAISRS